MKPVTLENILNIFIILGHKICVASSKWNKNSFVVWIEISLIGMKSTLSKYIFYKIIHRTCGYNMDVKAYGQYGHTRKELKIRKIKYI